MNLLMKMMMIMKMMPMKKPIEFEPVSMKLITSIFSQKYYNL